MSAKNKTKNPHVDYFQTLFAIADAHVDRFIADWNATIPGSIATLTNRPPAAFRYEITVTMPDKPRRIHISTDAAQLPVNPKSVFELIVNRNAVTLD